MTSNTPFKIIPPGTYKGTINHIYPEDLDLRPQADRIRVAFTLDDYPDMNIFVNIYKSTDTIYWNGLCANAIDVGDSGDVGIAHDYEIAGEVMLATRIVHMDGYATPGHAWREPYEDLMKKKAVNFWVVLLAVIILGGLAIIVAGL